MKRKTKRFYISTISIVLSLIMLLTSTVFAAPNVDSLKTEQNKLQSELKSLQSQLTDIMEEMDRLERDMAEKGEEIAQAEMALAEAEENEVKQQEAMEQRIVVMYENGSGSMLTSILEAESFAELLSRAEAINKIHEYDRKQLQEYISTKNEISELKTRLEMDFEKIQAMAQTYEQKQASVDAMIQEKETELANCKSELEAAIKKAAEEAARKAAEEAERKRREEEAKKQQLTIESNKTQSSNNHTSTNAATGDRNVGQAIVAAARTQLGVDYVWGGTKPYKGLDCSGLTQYCHKTVGISIPRVSGDQARRGKEIASLADALPGDIICYPGHVAIYIGNYRVIHAPHTGDVVKEATVYLKTITAIRRYW